METSTTADFKTNEKKPFKSSNNSTLIEKHSKICYNSCNLDLEETRGNGMSFVGFIKCTDGVLAFADCKGTRGKYQEENKERGLIKKVF